MNVWALDTSFTFLNHGSFGACPAPVLALQSELRARLEAEPIRYLLRELEPAFDAARETLAAFIGADAQDLVRVSNATEGVNTVLRSLQLSADDDILVTNHGYNACVNAARATGARVVVAQVPFPIQSPQQVIDAVLSAVTAKTKVALLDHVTSPTGLVFPLKQLVDRLHEQGVPTLVDGAHAPGMLPLSLRELDADWYTGNLHKWVCAPKVAGFLYVRRSLQASVRPLVISHGANAPPSARSRFHVEFDWPGTFDPTPWLCVPKCLEVLASLEPGGLPEVMAKNHALAIAGRDLVLRALGTKAPAPDEMIGSLAAMLVAEPAVAGSNPIPGSAFDPLQNRLYEAHRIEVPVFNFGAPPVRLLRISAQRYNTLAEFEKLAAAL